MENGLNDLEFRNFQNYFNRMEFSIRTRKDQLNQVIKEARIKAKKATPVVPKGKADANQPKDEAYMLEPYDPENLTYFEDETL